MDGDEAGDADAAPAPPPCACCGSASRYRCPACDTRTCSLACVNRHKAERPCTGRRDDTQFRAVQAFDDTALTRDYRLLEGMVRAVDSSKRRRRETERPSAARTAHNGLTPARQHLYREASKKGVQLELMPHGMQRQRDNTTRFDARQRSILWRVELRFASAGVRHTLPSVPEKWTIGDVLSELISGRSGGGEQADGRVGDGGATATSGHGGGGLRSGGGDDDSGQRALLRHKLRIYAGGVQPGAPADAAVAVFLPCEGPRRRADAPRFWRLPLDAPLSEALKGKVVVEFPTLHVARGAVEAATFALLEEAEEAAEHAAEPEAEAAEDAAEGQEEEVEGARPPPHRAQADEGSAVGTVEG